MANEKHTYDHTLDVAGTFFFLTAAGFCHEFVSLNNVLCVYVVCVDHL